MQRDHASRGVLEDPLEPRFGTQLAPGRIEQDGA